MKGSKVAKAVLAGMDRDGVKSVGWGDSRVLDWAGDLVKVKIDHPLNRMRAIFACLDRAPEFEKRFRISGNSRGAEVRVRTFRLMVATEAGNGAHNN